jgi:hypothetical protein
MGLDEAPAPSTFPANAGTQIRFAPPVIHTLDPRLRGEVAEGRGLGTTPHPFRLTSGVVRRINRALFGAALVLWY